MFKPKQAITTQVKPSPKQQHHNKPPAIKTSTIQAKYTNSIYHKPKQQHSHKLTKTTNYQMSTQPNSHKQQNPQTTNQQPHQYKTITHYNLTTQQVTRNQPANQTIITGVRNNTINAKPIRSSNTPTTNPGTTTCNNPTQPPKQQNK